MAKAYPWCIGDRSMTSFVCRECTFRDKCFLETFYRVTPDFKIVRVMPRNDSRKPSRYVQNCWVKKT